MPIINSILDTDLYKLTMQAAVLRNYPNAQVRYSFIDRSPRGRFNDEFFFALQEHVGAMADLRLTDEEAAYLSKKQPSLGPAHLAYLKGYRFDLGEVFLALRGGDLTLEVEGTWASAILWEVPLMAIISELYFRHCDKGWVQDEEGQRQKLGRKAQVLQNTSFSDFGTRRRRSFETQDLVVKTLGPWEEFVGTSNVHLAMKHGVNAVGTMGHEWVMGVSALEGLRHANRFALERWNETFRGRFGVALADTFGTDAFLRDFDGRLARLYDGVRQDSGDPMEFALRMIAHWKSLGVDPRTKTVVFSDGLNAEKAAEIGQALWKRINPMFGIGTNLTNDFPGSLPLNMVIKMTHCGGVPVVKLSDDPGKQCGDQDALRVAYWTFRGTPLDGK